MADRRDVVAKLFVETLATTARRRSVDDIIIVGPHVVTMSQQEPPACMLLLFCASIIYAVCKTQQEIPGALFLLLVLAPLASNKKPRFRYLSREGKSKPGKYSLLRFRLNRVEK